MEVQDGQDGKEAQFIVRVRQPGVVSLQSANCDDNWLGVIDGKLIGSVS